MKQAAVGNQSTLVKGGDGEIYGPTGSPHGFTKSSDLELLSSYQPTPIDARRSGVKGSSSSPLDVWKPLNKSTYSKGSYIEGEYDK